MSAISGPKVDRLMADMSGWSQSILLPLLSMLQLGIGPTEMSHTPTSKSIINKCVIHKNFMLLSFYHLAWQMFFNGPVLSTVATVATKEIESSVTH